VSHGTNAYPCAAFTRWNMPALHVIQGGHDQRAGGDDVLAVIDEHMAPALLGLRAATEDGDEDAIRAYAYELIFLSGCVLSPGAHRSARR
jgi:hypothetical protein